MLLRTLVLAISVFTLSLQAGSIGEVAYSDYYRMRQRNAIKVYKEGLKNAIQLADRKREVIYLNNIATIFHTGGIPDSCRHYLEQARTAAGTNSMLLMMVNINTSLFNNQPLEINEDQIKSYSDSLTAFELAALYIAGGRLALSSNPDKALSFFDRAHDALSKEKNSIGNANAYLYAASALFKKGDLRAALATAETAAGIFRKGGYVFGVKKCLRLEMAVFQKIGNTAEEEEVKKQLSRMP